MALCGTIEVICHEISALEKNWDLRPESNSYCGV